MSRRQSKQMSTGFWDYPLCAHIPLAISLQNDSGVFGKLFV